MALYVLNAFMVNVLCIYKAFLNVLKSEIELAIQCGCGCAGGIASQFPWCWGVFPIE
jgi:hypothetical protein